MGSWLTVFDSGIWVGRMQEVSSVPGEKVLFIPMDPAKK